MALSTPPPIPQRGDRATFGDRLDAFLRWLGGFVAEFNAAIAALSSWLAGGAFSIPYTWGANGGVAGCIGLGGGNATQNGTTALDISNISSAGKDMGPLLSQFDQSSSGVKGYLRIAKVGDSSVFIDFAVTARTAGAGGNYQYVQGSTIHASSQNPFANGDAVTLFFDRTGDKGNQGDPGINGTTPSINLPAIHVREEYAQGTNGASGPTTVNARAFNTVKLNTIPGASLVGGNVNLPNAGTYNFVGNAPAIGVNGHQAQLWNIATGAAIDLGTVEYSSSTSQVAQTRSWVRGQFTLGAGGATISLRHLMGGATGYLGLAANRGTEIYAELRIEKVG